MCAQSLLVTLAHSLCSLYVACMVCTITHELAVVLLICSTHTVCLFRYRTQLCNDGTKCRRHICFFAHSLEELRVPTVKPFVPPDALAAATTAAAAELARKSATANAVSFPASLLVHCSTVACSALAHAMAVVLPVTWI